MSKMINSIATLINITLDESKVIYNKVFLLPHLECNLRTLAMIYYFTMIKPKQNKNRLFKRKGKHPRQRVK